MNYKDAKKTVVMTTIVYIILGILLLIWHDKVAKTIGYIIGCLLLMMGGALIFSYVSRKEKTPDGGNNFAIGGLVATLGVITLVKVEAVVGLLPMAMGIIIIISGFVKLQKAVDLYRMNAEGVFGVGIMALLTLGFGAVLLLNPFESASTLIMILGAGLLFCGVTDLIIGLSFYSRMDRYEKEKHAIDVEAKG